VIHVVDSGLAGGVDDDVLESARTDGRVLVSSDTDFGELLARAGAALPRLILFRQGNRAPEHQVATLLGNLEQVAEDLDEVPSSCSPTTTSGFADCRSRTDPPNSRRRAAR
jgi:predicted nuclease of predicted toxin-antitoxin system